MVAQTQFDPQNPDALFSPDQWLNQFSNFNNKALPWPSSYAGVPTNAMGQPIQPPPGTTLNSAPQAAAPQAAAPQPNSAQQLYNQMSGPSAMNPTGNPAFGASEWGFGLGAQGAVDRNSPAYQMDPSGNGTGAGGIGTGVPGTIGGQAAPQAAAPAAPNSWQNTMAMLANPGKVTTPGATVPASASAQPGSANLQSFLANWKPAQSGPGAGFQQNFATALRGMGY